MFYVKGRISEGVEVTIDLDEENVFCRCPSCGEEVAVDLSDVCASGDVNFRITSVLCDRCARMIFGGTNE